MKVLSIVVTYNSESWVNYCIPSLEKSNYPCDIICIDNNSSDNTIETIKENYKQVILIESNTNLGFGKANNIGFEYFLKHNYDYALLLNQDAKIDTDTLEKLIDIHSRNNSYGIISPIHRAKSDTALDPSFSNYLGSKNTPNLIDDLILRNEIKEIYPTNFVNAAIWLISKKCIEEVGVFDPIFDHYGEDSDYVIRTLKKGFKVGIAPHVFANHARYKIKQPKSHQNFNNKPHLKFSELQVDYNNFISKGYKRNLFFIRKMIAEAFHNLIMLDSENLAICIKSYTKLFKKNLTPL